MIKSLTGYREDLEYNESIPAVMSLMDNAEEMPMHYHNAFEVIMVIEGECIVTLGGVDYTLLEGDALFISPGIIHSLKGNGAGKKYILNVNAGIFREVPESEKLLESFSSFAIYDENVAENIRILIRKRMQILWSHYSSDAVYKHFHFYASIMVLFAIAGTANLEAERINTINERHTDKHKAILDQICDYINKNCEKNLDAEEIARRNGFSVSHFYRLFTAYTGKSFAVYLTEQRVILAKRLLSMNLSSNIIDVGMLCGFTSISSFNRAFKKITGITPSVFRKRHLGEK